MDCIKTLYIRISLKAIILALNVLISKYMILAESETEVKKKKINRNLQNEFSNVMLMDEF